MVMKAAFANGTDEDKARMFRECLEVLQAKASRNRIRKRYVEGKMPLKDFGISVPPQLRSAKTPVGWPKKAVDELAKRSRFEGYTCDDPDMQSMLDALVLDNAMRLEYRQAVRSELTLSCSFAAVSLDGGTGRASVSFYSALTASGVWDYERRRLAYGIAVADFDKRHRPTKAYLYHGGGIDAFELSGGVWESEYLGGSAMGEPMMVVLANEPDLDRPFGRSRITREVMGTTDAAVRAFLNADIASHFAASPQKYMLGVDRSVAEGQTKWEAYLGSIFAVGTNKNGDIPNFGQLAQPSMEPHRAWIQTLAAKFAGEAGIPVTALGIIHDNPASAEAMHAADNGLVQSAEELNEANGEALVKVAKMAIAIGQNKPLRPSSSRASPRASRTPTARQWRRRRTRPSSWRASSQRSLTRPSSSRWPDSRPTRPRASCRR